MSTQPPTTAEIRDNIIVQIAVNLNQAIPLLPKAFTRVLATALAGVYVLLYKYAGWVLLQQFVARASFSESTVLGQSIRPLVEWGRLIGAGDPIPAQPFEGTVTVTVENQTGTLAAGTQLRNVSTGAVYLTSASTPLNAATVTAPIIAAEGGPADAAGLQVSDQLQFANALPNVSRTVTVASVTQAAIAAETTEAYRERVIFAFQRRPQGGAYADYYTWARTVAGVAGVYPYTGDPGQVDVYIESTTDPDGIPTQPLLDAVSEAIEFTTASTSPKADRRPANAFVNVLPITRTGFVVDVLGLTVSNPAQVQADITSAVLQHFQQREPFIVGLSTPPRLDQISNTAVASVVGRIVTEAQGIFTGVTLRLTGSGDVTPIYTLGSGEKAKATAVNYP